MQISFTPLAPDRIVVRPLYADEDQFALFLTWIKAIAGRSYSSDTCRWSIPDTGPALPALLNLLHSTGLFHCEIAEPVPTLIDRDLKRRYTEELKVRHYRPRTCETYANWLDRYLRTLERPLC